ncbi:MAG: phosphatase PAP2 family protein, partial [Ignavibacteriales bacterium]|nr:phosphatase PAP2 family protein [Ignavibacteriales bacterium]
LILTYFFFLWKGSKQTRTALLLLIPLIIFSDQLNSSLLKNIFERPRPCVSLENVRLLVSCGSGYSFPSSHAVNNFAIATLLSMYFRNYRILFFAFASLVAYSRVYVGVHYPSDIIAGALIGICCAYTLNWTWEKIQTSYFPMLKKE